jgi:hypothetical protein
MREAVKGEIVELKNNGKFFVGQEEVFIPHKKTVLIIGYGADVLGWWRMTLDQALKNPKADQSIMLISPFEAMTEFFTVVDCLKMGIKQIEILS